MEQQPEQIGKIIAFPPQQSTAPDTKKIWPSFQLSQTPLRHCPQRFLKELTPDVCLSDLIPTEFSVFQRELANNPPWPWYFMGKSGSGKTVAAAILTRYWPLNNYPAEPRGPLMIEAGILIRDWVAGKREGHAVDANLLVVDDIGLRELTEAQREALMEIVNVRGPRPTIYTGNFTLEELPSGIGDKRIARRISGGLTFPFENRRWTEHARIVKF